MKMDEEFRARGGSRPSSRPDKMLYERRPLKQVPLTPPDYKVHAHVLVDSYIEKEVKFAGVVLGVLTHMDATNRTEVLRVIDRGKREKRLPASISPEHDAILSLNAHNIKLSRREGNEELLLRVPIHEIAAVCYVRDDDQHIIGIKYGVLLTGEPRQGSFGDNTPGSIEDTETNCKMAVLYCENRGSAVEICCLVDQCFMHVYQDATMRYFDNNVRQGCGGKSYESPTLRSDKSGSSTPKMEVDHKNLGFFSQSSLELDHVNGGTISSMTTRSLPQTPTHARSLAPSDSELSSTANEMIQNYMERLYNKLTQDELRKFAQIVKSWQNNLTTKEFCEKVFELYGPERKHLLIGMRPFIDDKDMPFYEEFLEHIGLASAARVDHLASGSLSRAYRRPSLASSHTNMTGDKYDKALDDLVHNMEQLEASVDVSTNPDVFLPKST